LSLIKFNSFGLDIIVIFRNVNFGLIRGSGDFGVLFASPPRLDQVLLALVVDDMLQDVLCEPFGFVDHFLVALLAFKIVHFDDGVGQDVI